MKIQIQQIEPKGYLSRLHDKNYQIALSSWIAQFNDPINLLERFKDKDNSKNYPGWENRLYRQLLEDAMQTSDPETRLELLKKGEAMIEEERLIAPLYHWRSPVLVHPRLHNFTTSSSGAILFEKASVVQSETAAIEVLRLGKNTPRAD